MRNDHKSYITALGYVAYRQHPKRRFKSFKRGEAMSFCGTQVWQPVDIPCSLSSVQLSCKANVTLQLNDGEGQVIWSGMTTSGSTSFGPFAPGQFNFGGHKRRKKNCVQWRIMRGKGEITVAAVCFYSVEKKEAAK